MNLLSEMHTVHTQNVHLVSGEGPKVIPRDPREGLYVLRGFLSLHLMCPSFFPPNDIFPTIFAQLCWNPCQSALCSSQEYQCDHETVGPEC